MSALWRVSSPPQFHSSSPGSSLWRLRGYPATQGSGRVDEPATRPARRCGTVQKKTPAVFLLIRQSPARAVVCLFMPDRCHPSAHAPPPEMRQAFGEAITGSCDVGDNWSSRRYARGAPVYWRSPDLAPKCVERTHYAHNIPSRRVCLMSTMCQRRRANQWQ